MYHTVKATPAAGWGTILWLGDPAAYVRVIAACSDGGIVEAAMSLDFVCRDKRCPQAKSQHVQAAGGRISSFQAKGGVNTMIELFLSTDGKHTVHVSADTPEQMTELVPKAKALYQEVLAEFSAKAERGQTAVNGTGHTDGQAKRNGYAQAGKRTGTASEAQGDAIPHCPMHQTPMRYRQGRMGPFWSCPTRKPDGRWCQITKEVIGANVA